MKITFLHLSDIHLHDTNDFILTQADNIAAAASSFWNEVQAFVIIVTGDIAFSGQTAQYDLALRFFEDLKEQLSRQFQNIPFHFVIIPGNHDCDFSKSQDLRDAALIAASKAAFSNGANLSIKSELVTSGLAVQENFFAFCRKLEPTLAYPASPVPFYQIALAVKGHEIVFNCINTAWCSRLKEKQGEMIFPVDWFTAAETEIGRMEPAQLVISIFHHPYNWLENNNSLEFRRRLEKVSDLILTGHEHTPDFYQKNRPHEDNLQFVEGSALQESPAQAKSEFQLLVVDFTEQKQKLFKFKWEPESKQYRERQNTSWGPFTRNRYLLRQGFTNLTEFSAWLQDLGLTHRHGHQRQPILQDLFIYPRLLSVVLSDILKGKRTGNPIDGERVIDFLLEKKYVMIFGQTLGGKTTLAKAIYSDVTILRTVFDNLRSTLV